MRGDPGGGSAWASDGGEVMQFREELRFRHLRGGLAGPGPGGRQRVVPRSEAVVDGAPPRAAFVHLRCGRGLAELDGKGLQIVYRPRRRNRALRPGVVEAGRLQRVAPRTKAGAKRAVGVFAVLAVLPDRRCLPKVVGNCLESRRQPVVAAPCRYRSSSLCADGGLNVSLVSLGSPAWALARGCAPTRSHADERDTTYRWVPLRTRSPLPNSRNARGRLFTHR